MDRLTDVKIEIISLLRDFMLCRFPNLSQDEIPFSIIRPTGCFSHYGRIRVGSYSLKIKDVFINDFLKSLKDYKTQGLTELCQIINNSYDDRLTLHGWFPRVSIKDEGSYYDDGAMGIDYSNVEKHFKRLNSFVTGEVRRILSYIDEAMIQFNKDGTKVKDEELYIQFSTLHSGKDTSLFLALTKIPYRVDPEQSIYISTSPMTELEKEHLFSYKDQNDIFIKTKIENTLIRINKRINDFAQCKEGLKYKSCEQQVIKLINSILISIIKTIRGNQFSSFGGGYGQLVNEGNTQNAKVCFNIIDAVVQQLWTLLSDLESENKIPDIAYFALDIDSFNIYGMNDVGKPIYEINGENSTFKHAIERFYSTGVMNCFKGYLKTIRNKHVFTHKGFLDVDSIRHTPKK